MPSDMDMVGFKRGQIYPCCQMQSPRSTVDPDLPFSNPELDKSDTTWVGPSRGGV